MGERHLNRPHLSQGGGQPGDDRITTRERRNQRVPDSDERVDVRRMKYLTIDSFGSEPYVDGWKCPERDRAPAK